MMNYPTFNQGDTFQCDKWYTREDVSEFARLTGDDNPIHIDEEFGKRSQFGRNIVHGNLLISSFSATTREGFTGPGTVVLQKECHFVRPVFIEENYKLTIRIASVNPAGKSASVKYFLRDSEGKICVRVKSLIRNEKIFGV